jgi:hypothetical protein
VRDEICRDHLADKHNGHRSGKQSGDQEESASQLDHAGNSKHRHQRDAAALNAAEETEEFLQTMLQEEHACRYAKHGVRSTAEVIRHESPPLFG